jgi:hypothetical protein
MDCSRGQCWHVQEALSSALAYTLHQVPSSPVSLPVEALQFFLMKHMHGAGTGLSLDSSCVSEECCCHLCRGLGNSSRQVHSAMTEDGSGVERNRSRVVGEEVTPHTHIHEHMRTQVHRYAPRPLCSDMSKSSKLPPGLPQSPLNLSCPCVGSGPGAVTEFDRTLTFKETPGWRAGENHTVEPESKGWGPRVAQWPNPAWGQMQESVEGIVGQGDR